jgi:hypothetical protein
MVPWRRRGQRRVFHRGAAPRLALRCEQEQAEEDTGEAFLLCLLRIVYFFMQVKRFLGACGGCRLHEGAFCGRMTGGDCMMIWINGTFGAGKTQVAYELRRLASRGEGKRSWAARQIDRCLRAFDGEMAGDAIQTDDLTIPQVVESIAAAVGVPLAADRRGPLRRRWDRFLALWGHIR